MRRGDLRIDARWALRKCRLPVPAATRSLWVAALSAVLALMGSSIALASPAASGTTGGLFVAQSGNTTCLATPTDHVTLTGAVNANDELVLLVSGQGYDGNAPVVNSVSDPVNGTWSAMSNIRSVTGDGHKYLSYAVYVIRKAKASSGINVTINQTAGQSGSSATLVDVRGSGGILHSQFAPSITHSWGPGIGNTSVEGGNGTMIVELFGIYNYGESAGVGPGWTMQSSVAGCSRVVSGRDNTTASGMYSASGTIGSETWYLGGELTFIPVTSTPSTPGPSAPVNTAPPIILGTAQQGQTLTASPGTWSNSPTSYAYQWQSCSSSSCANISGATSSTYTAAAADVGKTLDVVVTASNSAGSTRATSGRTATVTGTSTPTPTPPPAPVNSAAPTISGTAQQGQTLTASPGTWSNSPTSYAYQWQSCASTCSNISGATSSTYTAASSDVGKTLDVVVTATNAGGASSATSAKTATVSAPPTPAPVNSAAPTISGTAQQGQTLTASPGTWSNSPTSYAYQWQSCSSSSCANISGATTSTYTAAAADVGNTLDVVVTATNSGGSAHATSSQTAAVTAAPSGGGGGGGGGLTGLHVRGNELVDGSGNVVHLHGVNRSGTEYACIQGWGMFDGPNDAPSVAAMASWHINVVRVPLNEDCWLGINGANPAYSGANYINAVVNYVNLLHSYGMYAELSLMFGAPGNQQATFQNAAPDEDHSPAMWASMAQTFKNDSNVILAPWSETWFWPQTSNWQCWENGCNNLASYGGGPFDGDGTCGNNCYYYTTAGTQQAVTVMRNNGYHGPIAITCLDYANGCGAYNNNGMSGSWVQYKPTDPDNSLMAEVHLYGGNGCATVSCLNQEVTPIRTAGYPVILGETGEYYNWSDCPSTSYMQQFIPWAEANDVGMEAWAWDTWGACSGGLVSNYNGTAAQGDGQYIQSNYTSTYPPNP